MPVNKSKGGGGGGGGLGGTLGSTDNAIPRADGTGGSTLQASLASCDDSGWFSIPDTDGTRYRFGSGNTPALIYSSSSLLLQPGGINTLAVSNVGYNGANFYAGRNAEYTVIFDGDSSKSVIIQGQDRNGISSYSQNLVIRAGDQTISSNAESGADATLRAGNSNSSNASSDNGNLNLLAGSGTHASNNNAGGDVTIAPGTSAGSGGNGNLILNNIKTATAASDAMTMTNGPTGTAGNPTRFIRVVIDGSNYIMPLWPG